MRKSVFILLPLITLLIECVFTCVQAAEKPMLFDRDIPVVQTERIGITVHNDTWQQRTLLKGTIDYKGGSHESFKVFVEGITDICPRTTNHIPVPKGLVKSISLILSNYRDDPLPDDEESTVIAVLLLNRIIPSTLTAITFTIQNSGIAHMPQFYLPPKFNEAEGKWSPQEDSTRGLF